MESLSAWIRLWSTVYELRLICFGGKLGAIENTNVHGHDQWNSQTHVRKTNTNKIGYA